MQIDSQHKQLITAINNLLIACSTGQGQAAIDKTIAFLGAYTDKHFGDEEHLQILHYYPDYINHKQMHEEFQAVVNDLAARLRQEGPTDALVSAVNSQIADWLINHIKTQDKKLAAHIRNNP